MRHAPTGVLGTADAKHVVVEGSHRVPAGAALQASITQMEPGGSLAASKFEGYLACTRLLLGCRWQATNQLRLLCRCLHLDKQRRNRLC